MSFFHDAPDVLEEIATVPTLGADIRALRKARGLTLTDMATALDRSVGWLSQVERDISHPEEADLTRIARLLDVSVTSFKHAGTANAENGLIVRAGHHRPIGGRAPGLTEALLSPDLTDDFEMIHSTFAPGAAITEPVHRATQEVGYVLSGQLSLTIAARTFHLGPGDSFRLRGQSFTWANQTNSPCQIIWVISPPVY